MNGYIYCTEHIENRLIEFGHMPIIEIGRKHEVENIIRTIAKDSLVALSSIEPVGSNKEEYYCCYNIDAVFAFRYTIIPEDKIEDLFITEDKVYSNLYAIVNDYFTPSPELDASEVSCELPAWENTTALVQSYVKRNTSWLSTILRLKLNMYSSLYRKIYGVSERIRVKHAKTERELISETNRLHGYKESQPLIEGVK